MICSRRKRLQLSRVLFLLSGVSLCTLYQLTISARLQAAPLEFVQGSAEGPEENVTEDIGSQQSGHTVQTSQPETLQPETLQPETLQPETLQPETLQPETLQPERVTTAPSAVAPPTNKTLIHCIYVAPEPPLVTPTPLPAPPEAPNAPESPADAPHVKGEYPEDLFTVEERRRGWVILHILGMIYMFVSLAIVCDEFFVPALGVITDKLAISDDVAGATFMAAGGSAPELFTSLIGVFIAHSNVGIGTIVGSAVFNILFVIGMCALFSREMLHLTWWPLFRDVSFYILDLVMLIVFFLDNVIVWWESLMLVGGYTLYVVFMKYNVQIERFVKTLLLKHKNIIKIITVDEAEKVNGDVAEPEPPIKEDKNRLKLKPALQRGGSSASLHNSTMRNTIFQLMIHTLDPLGEGKFKDKAETLNNVASKKAESKRQDKKADGAQKPEGDAPKAPDAEKKEAEDDKKEEEPENSSSDGSADSSGDSDETESETTSDDSDLSEEQEEEEEEPLSLQWPDTPRKQATYLFLLPIIIPLWLTVPDVRNQKSRKFFVMTFLGSIAWIAIFSYLMVWWAHQVGETIGISEEIMGLTILAAGTSIPDLITSVIVARKGLGDMAVSSSVGSNIFDITVGLPVPWLMYSIGHGFAPVAVSSNGLFCAIVLLFLMLLFVIISIAWCKWKMNKLLGSTMFLLYFIFLVLSVMLEDRIIVCPISI